MNRGLVRRLLLALPWLLIAGVAPAASLPFTGSLEIRLLTSFGLPSVNAPGSGAALVNGSGSPGHLTGLGVPASAFATSGATVPVSDPAVFPIAGLQLTVHNQAGNFVGSGGAGFAGPMALDGFVKICLYGTCGASNNVTNLNVPLSVVGTNASWTVMGGVNLTVIGAPWTTGTAAIGTITAMGGVAPASNTGAPSGTVTLVTPIFVSANIEAVPLWPSFGILTLHFVPEPGTLVLLAGGVGALAGYGRRRMRA